MRNNLLGGYLEGLSDPLVAHHCEIKDYRTVGRWRRGEHFPQPRLWGKLAFLLGRSVKDIEAAHAAYKHGLGRGGGDGQASASDDASGGGPDGGVVLAGQSAGQVARGVGDDGPRALGSRAEVAKGQRVSRRSE